MAKNIGLLKISGKLGELQFIEMNGNTYVRLPTSLNKHRLMSDPNYHRARENMVEFGACSTISVSIRQCITPLNRLIEKNLHTRLMAPLRALIELGSGIRGQRNAEFSLYAQDFEEMELNRSAEAAQIMRSIGSVSCNPERNQITWSLPAIYPEDLLVLPEGATHFKVVLAALAVSDFSANGPNHKYQPVNADQHGLFQMATSDLIACNDTSAGPITLTATLPNSPVLDPNVSLFTFIGIEFIQQVNNTNYPLTAHNAVRIAKVFLPNS